MSHRWMQVRMETQEASAIRSGRGVVEIVVVRQRVYVAETHGGLWLPTDRIANPGARISLGLE